MEFRLGYRQLKLKPKPKELKVVRYGVRRGESPEVKGRVVVEIDSMH